MKSSEPNQLQGMDRRNFGRLLALGSTGALMSQKISAWSKPAPFPPVPVTADEKFWTQIRGQFVLAPDLAVMNAANLCPSPASVLDIHYKYTRDIDQDPSFNNRAKFSEGKKKTRRLLAQFLNVTPEEIILTRNTSEANNFVSNGLDLKAGDEVVIFSDNHPSNHLAWREKAKRFGYTVRIVEQINPHPGTEYYVNAFAKQMNARTKVLAFTHVTNTVGDRLPAKELCRLAREWGALSLVDGAQSFGVMDLDLKDIQPDFYSGSAHKWPCGPRETGVLYVNQRAQDRISPSLISLYVGSIGISKTFEGLGQRDNAGIIALGEALEFQNRIGRPTIEKRSQELTQALIEGLKKIEGIKLWTHPDLERSLAVVTFRPGNLDAGKLYAALYEKDRIACTAKRGSDRGGIRFSPHLYNTHKEVDRILAAMKHYMSHGV